MEVVLSESKRWKDRLLIRRGKGYVEIIESPLMRVMESDKWEETKQGTKIRIPLKKLGEVIGALVKEGKLDKRLAN